MTPTSNSVPAMSGPLRRPRQTPCPLRSSSTILQQLMKNLFAHLRGVEPKSLWILARPHLRPVPSTTGVTRSFSVTTCTAASREVQQTHSMFGVWVIWVAAVAAAVAGMSPSISAALHARRHRSDGAVAGTSGPPDPPGRGLLGRRFAHLPFLRPLPLLLPLPFRSRLRLRSRRSSRRSSLRGLSRFSLWRYPWPGGITKLPPRESLNVVVTGRTLRPPASRGLGSRCLSFPRAERSRSSVLCRAGDSAAAAGRSGRGGGAEL